MLKKKLLDYMDSYNAIVGNVLLISHYNVLHGDDFTIQKPLFFLYSQIAVRKALSLVQDVKHSIIGVKTPQLAKESSSIILRTRYHKTDNEWWVRMMVQLR